MPLQPYIGQIMPAGFATIPRGWAPCNGATMSISQNQALFSVLGTVYGGDGRTTFALPDLQGRAVMGANLGSIGQINGSETVTLTTDQLPSHTHIVQASTTLGSARPAANLFGEISGESIFAVPGSNDVALPADANVTPQGGGAPHNNMQPFLVVNYMIALQGLYPPRS